MYHHKSQTPAKWNLQSPSAPLFLSRIGFAAETKVSGAVHGLRHEFHRQGPSAPSMRRASQGHSRTHDHHQTMRSLRHQRPLSTLPSTTLKVLFQCLTFSAVMILRNNPLYYIFTHTILSFTCTVPHTTSHRRTDLHDHILETNIYSRLFILRTILCTDSLIVSFSCHFPILII
jgi:hypothetical protein